VVDFSQIANSEKEKKMERKSFTGKELAEAHLLHLTNEELWEYVKKDKTKSRVHSNGFFATLWRRIRPG